MGVSGRALLIALTACALQLPPTNAWPWSLTIDRYSTYAMALDARGDLLLGGIMGSPPLGFGVLAVTGAGRLRWAHVIHRTAHDVYGRALAVARRGGDVVAAGAVADPTLDHTEFTVAVLSRTTGRERWRRVIRGTGGDGQALLVLDDGDIIAGGAWSNVDSLDKFTVVRLSGARGTVSWQSDLGEGDAFALAVDPRGDIVVTGQTYAATSHFTVVKLAAADGAVLWRQEPARLSYAVQQGVGLGSSPTVVTDAAGDVVTAGLGPGVTAGTIMKLSGADGSVLWGQPITAPPDTILIDPASDIVVGYGATVAKLSGRTGVDIWRQALRGAQSAGTGIALDPAGDVIFTGVSPEGRRNDLPIIKLVGSTGDHVWSQTVTGPARMQKVGISEGVGGAVAIDPAGAIRAVGLVGRAVIDDGGPDLTPTSADGTGRWGRLPPSVPSLILFAAQFSDRIAGRSLRVRTSSAGAALRLVAVDRNILAPATGSPGDPTQDGAILTVSDELAGTRLSLPLAASGWSASGRPQGSVYRYRAAQGASPFCRDVRLATDALTVRCAGDVPPITLAELGPRGVAVVLTLPGSGFRYCLRFLGTVSATRTAQRRFVAGPAPAPATCPAIAGAG